jgi:hypothetical protein
VLFFWTRRKKMLVSGIFLLKTLFMTECLMNCENHYKKQFIGLEA